MDGDGQTPVGFVVGKVKFAPQSEFTIPRLELCGAVLAVEMAELVLEKIDLNPNNAKFYCDSKVILGCIYNKTKHFYVYVHNWVQCICQSTRPEQWFYIPTDHNPADLASISVPTSRLADNLALWTGLSPQARASSSRNSRDIRAS